MCTCKLSRFSLILSIIFLISGIYSLYTELKSGIFIVHRSMATLFIALSIGLFFNYKIKQLGMK